jgi:hypothetical protein
MKTFKMKTAMALVVVALFSVSCGKDKKKKNTCDIYNPMSCGYGYNQGQYLNGQYFNQYNQTGTNPQAFQALQNYLNASESASGTVQLFYTVYSSTNYSELDLGLFKVPYSTSFQKQPKSLVETITFEKGVRKNFSNLISLSSNQVFSVSQNPQSPHLIEVYTGSSMANMKRYLIDTNLHGSINPRQLDDFGAGKTYVLQSH